MSILPISEPKVEGCVNCGWKSDVILPIGSAYRLFFIHCPECGGDTKLLKLTVFESIKYQMVKFLK